MEYNYSTLTAVLGRATMSPVTQASIVPGEAPSTVHYSVTVTITVLVGILFLLVYIQLIMVICFGYKLFSYQTVLLYDILLWAALRLTLYSFYYYHCCDLVVSLTGKFAGWLLVAFPSALQYFSLAVLVHYFGENIFKVLGRRQEMSSLVPPYRQMRIYRILGEFLWVTSVLIFLAGNVAFYFLIGRKNPASDGTMSILVILRVVLLDGLFLIMGITLGVCIIMIYTTRAGKDVLEVQRGGKVFPLLISALLILLFASRDIYSLTAAITNSRNSGYWILATDEGDYEFPSTGGSSKKYGYIAYFSVMMIWEVIPTYIIVFFFRVRIPHYHNLRSLKPLKVRRGSQSTIQRHFFDNPNRYDESEQLLSHPIQHQSSTTTHMSIPSLTSSNIAQLPHNHLYPHTTPGGYGSNQKTQSRYSINSHHHGNSSSGLSSVMPGTTPPQLFTSPSFFTDVEKKLSD